MKFQVFGCPSCHQPFQVSETQAGQVVHCPSCTQSVEIPVNTFVEIQPMAAGQPVCSCPICKRQFGITPDMLGQTVGCPHCQASVLVESPISPPEILQAPAIITDSTAGRNKTRTRQRWKSRTQPGDSKDAFAPGAEKSEPATTSDSRLPLAPVRRSDGLKPARSEPAVSGVLKPISENRNREDIDPPSRKPGSKSASKKRGDDPIEPRKKDGRGSPETARVPGALSSTPIKPGVPHVASPEAELDQADRSVPEVKPDEESDQPETTDQPGSIDHWLPPRFDVLDPSRMRLKTGKGQFQVILPDGNGGMKQIDQRLVRVEHEGTQVALVAMTEKEKKRRRLIQNIVAIVIGIIIMAIAFSLLV